MNYENHLSTTAAVQLKVIDFKPTKGGSQNLLRILFLSDRALRGRVGLGGVEIQVPNQVLRRPLEC